MLQFREKEVLAYGERQAFLISSGMAICLRVADLTNRFDICYPHA